MKVSQKAIPAERVVKVYTAFDGKEFYNYNECECYETELRDKLIADSSDVIENESAKGNMPFDGYEYHGECAYRWFMPLNKKGIELLNKLFGSELDDSDICNWLCMGIWDYDEYTYVTSLNSCISYVKEMLGKFGIDVEFHEGGDKCDKCQV